MNDSPRQPHIDMVTLGERGQVVIPAAIRERLKVSSGDRLMVFTKHDEMVCMIPASSLRRMADILNAQLAEIDHEENQNKKKG